MKEFIRIEPADIQVGKTFSTPVFFDDGKNMFLAEGKSVKPYHLYAIQRWKIPFLLTFSSKTESMQKSTSVQTAQNIQTADESQIQEVAEVEELDDVEELDEVEDLEELEEI